MITIILFDNDDIHPCGGADVININYVSLTRYRLERGDDDGAS